MLSLSKQNHQLHSMGFRNNYVNDELKWDDICSFYLPFTFEKKKSIGIGNRRRCSTINFEYKAKNAAFDVR